MDPVFTFAVKETVPPWKPLALPNPHEARNGVFLVSCSLGDGKSFTEVGQYFLYRIAIVWEFVTKTQLTFYGTTFHWCDSSIMIAAATPPPIISRVCRLPSRSFVFGQLRSENQPYVFGIVDGQHRLGALLLLSEEGLWNRSERNVVVEVFDTKDEQEIEELFAEINK